MTLVADKYSLYQEVFELLGLRTPDEMRELHEKQFLKMKTDSTIS
jgi:hypothetical protein